MKKWFAAKSISVSLFTLLIFISLLYSALFIVAPIILDEIINLQVTPPARLLIIFFVALISGHLIQTASVYLKNALVEKYRIHEVTRLFEKVFNLNYDFIVEKEPTYLVERVASSIEELSRFFYEALPGIITNLIMVIAILVMVFAINPIIAVMMLVTLPLNYLGFYFLNKELVKKSSLMNSVIPKEYKDMYQIVGQVDFIKQSADHSPTLLLLKKHMTVVEKLTKSVNNFANGISTALSALNLIIRNSILVLLAYLMLSGSVLIGDVFFITIALTYFVTASNAIVSFNVNMNGLTAAQQFIAEVHANQEKTGGIKIESIDEIDMRHMDIRIGDLQLLHDVNITLKKGDVVGIMGPSGSGKSTLVKALLKYRETEGIFINGVPLGEIENRSYRDRVSFYSQNAPIISATLLENLNFGRVPEKADEYARLSILKKFVDADSTLQTAIVENGNNLSGGDKQRIAIARLYFEDSDVVVLDEPTNSLDKDTEEELLKFMLAPNKNKITILITHTKEHLRYCTRSFVIRTGSLEEIDKKSVPLN